MGLDMYLTAKRYMYREEDEFMGFKIKEIVIEIAYWRKANQIHNWFVQNVQDSADDCRQYSVSREQLVELKLLCIYVIDNSKLIKGKTPSHQEYINHELQTFYTDGKVLEDSRIAEEYLPCVDGFFFGYVVYDESYMEDLKYTVKAINKALKLPKDWNFYYESSW